jgi:hypothetical protein
LTFQNARRAKARKRSVTVADVPMDCGSAPEKLVLHAKPEVFLFYFHFVSSKQHPSDCPSGFKKNLERFLMFPKF